jgi:hypothetical protein
LNATEWNNLSSGLLGAVIGAGIGSIAGFLGSMLLNWQSDRSKCKAAGRALLAEVARNYQALAYVGDHRPAGYSEVVWETQLPLIAQLLKWDELRAVAAPYVDASEPLTGFELADELRSRGEARRLTAGEGTRGLFQTLGVGQFDRNAEEVVKKCQEELTKVRSKFAAAAEVLRRKVLTRDEYQSFPQLLAEQPAGDTKDGNSTSSV